MRDELDLALAFAWPIATQQKQFYFPYYESYAELKNVFLRFFDKKGLYLIGIFNKDDIVALFPLVFKEDDNVGSWDKGIYLNGEVMTYETAMKLFREFIGRTLGFKHKRIYCGINNSYSDAAQYFVKEKSEILEEAYITNFKFDEFSVSNIPIDSQIPYHNLKIIDFKECYQNDALSKHCEEVLDEYFNYHDSSFPDYYWTSKRLKKQIHDFRILVAVWYDSEDSFVILGGMFIREIERVGDIHGLSDHVDKNKNHLGKEVRLTSNTVRELLLNQAIKNSHHNDMESIMFFCENQRDYNLAISKGFEDLGKYTVYLWHI